MCLVCHWKVTLLCVNENKELCYRRRALTILTATGFDDRTEPFSRYSRFCVYGIVGIHLLKRGSVGDDSPGGGAQGCYQGLQETSDEYEGVLPSDNKIESGKNKDSVYE